MAKSSRGGAGGSFTSSQRAETNAIIDRAVNISSAFDSDATADQRRKTLKGNIISVVSSELNIPKSRATALVNQELKKRRQNN